MDSQRFSWLAERMTNPSGAGKLRILILGGTSEGRALAEALSLRTDIDAMISLAGRTLEPKPLPLPTRIGGFGGVDGLASALGDCDALIDATHPYAARISANAVAAARITGKPLLRIERPAWRAGSGDHWISVEDSAEAAALLVEQTQSVSASLPPLAQPVAGRDKGWGAVGPGASPKDTRNADAARSETRTPAPVPPTLYPSPPRALRAGGGTRQASRLERVFLSMGRLELEAFVNLPCPALLRTVDPVPANERRADWTYITGLGPFSADDEEQLLREHGISVIVTKNSGSAATAGKLEAARRLRLPVIMVERPTTPVAPCCATIAEALDWIDALHRGSAPTERAV